MLLLGLLGILASRGFGFWRVRFGLWFRLTFGRRRRWGTTSVPARWRCTGLFCVIGHIPAGTFKLHSRRGDQLLKFASAVRTDGERRIGEPLLYALRQAMTALTLVFVEWQFLDLRLPSNQGPR